MNIITHRGLQPSIANFPAESSRQAFDSQLKQGFGLEFDFNLTKDNQIVVFHDTDLKRITRGDNLAKFSDLTRSEVETIRLGDNDSLYFLDELLDTIEKSSAPMSALHLKGRFQADNKYLDILIACLNRHRSLLDRLLVFDVTVKTAKYLKSHLPSLNLAPSVAHSYDIKRYNDCVGGTLLSIEEVLANKELFTCVWLDEWDLTDRDGSQKKFYTAEVFNIFKTASLKIALVTPELHGTSPGLLGGEAHPEASSEKLFARLTEIITLQPDALCTDHPQELQALIELC